MKDIAAIGYDPIKAKPWTNPLPAVGISGEVLSAFWQARCAEAHGMYQRRWGSHRLTPEERLALASSRYDSKVEIKTYLAIYWGIHKMLAPDQPRPCGPDCAHVQEGLRPADLKRVLDALDRAAARAQRRYDEESKGDIVSRDLRTQIRCYEEQRRDIADLTGHSIPVPESPSEGSRLWGPRPNPAGAVLMVNGVVVYRGGEKVSRKEMHRRTSQALAGKLPEILERVGAPPRMIENARRTGRVVWEDEQ